MSSDHESHLAAMLGGHSARGSGCTFRDQADGRQPYQDGSFVAAWDGKSTFGKGIAVTREMWGKIVDQAHWARPLLALRFYRSERLEVDLDLAALRLADLSELVEASRAGDRVRALLEAVRAGTVRYPPRDGQSGGRLLVADLLDLLDGRPATRGVGLPGVAA